MTEQIMEQIVSYAYFKEAATFLLSATPIIGIRAALPMAYFVFDMGIWQSYFWAVLGEFFPVVFILKFLGVISDWLARKFTFMDKFFQFLFSKTRRDYDNRVHRYGLFALFLYTGIPLPFSGAWTVSLVTFLFGLPKRKAIPVIFCGVLLSGLNIILIMELGIAIERYRGAMILIGLVMLLALISFMYYRRNSKKYVKSSTIS